MVAHHRCEASSAALLLAQGHLVPLAKSIPRCGHIVQVGEGVEGRVGVSVVLHSTVVRIESASAHSHTRFPACKFSGPHSLRNIPGHIVAIQTRNPGKRRVDAGRHAARRPDITVNRPAGMRDPVRRRISRNDARPRGLVSRRAHARKQPRPRDDHRPGAHRNQILKLGISLLDEIQRSLEIGVRSARAGAARDEQDFEVGGRGGEGVRGRDADEGAGVELVHRSHARPGGHGVHGLGEEGDVDFGGTGEGEESFVRAPDVEGFVGLEEDDAPFVRGASLLGGGMTADAYGL